MGLLSVALRKVRSATTFSAFEILLIAPVFVALGVARLAILVLPFRTYGLRFGQQAGLVPETVGVSGKRLSRARSVGKVVRSTAKITPWESLCLAQAMVAALLLRLAGTPYNAVFGVAPKVAGASDDLLDAHAWVRVGDVNVTGGQDVRRYTIVTVFKHVPRRAS